MDNPVWFGLMFILAMMIALGYGIVVGVKETFFPAVLTAEQSWVNTKISRCHAMKGRLDYDKATKTAECYRTPFMRQPKLVFSEEFKGE